MAKDVVSGLALIRGAMLLQLIATIVIVIGDFGGLEPLVALDLPATASSIDFTVVAIFLIVFIAGLALEVFALFRSRKGFRILRASDDDYGVGATGATLALIGTSLAVVGIIVLVGIITAALASATNTLAPAANLGAAVTTVVVAIIAVFVVGAVITFIGGILIAVGIFRIGGKYNVDLLKVGAVLYVLISFVGVILNYIGLGEVIRKARASARVRKA